MGQIPLPQFLPQVVALLPTTGKDDAAGILEQHLKLLGLAASLDLPILCFAADGAASELSAQNMMDKETSEFPPLRYDYTLYGMHLRVPVFKTGPLVSISDPPHGRKTCRNQPQYGTHTASLGIGHVVNRSLVALYETETSGLMSRDVHNVDKQDDGAARQVFHHEALRPMIIEEGNEHKIREGFHGLFVYLFVFGAQLSKLCSDKLLTVL